MGNHVVGIHVKWGTAVLQQQQERKKLLTLFFLSFQQKILPVIHKNHDNSMMI